MKTIRGTIQNAYRHPHPWTADIEPDGLVRVRDASGAPIYTCTPEAWALIEDGIADARTIAAAQLAAPAPPLLGGDATGFAYGVDATGRVREKPRP